MEDNESLKPKVYQWKEFNFGDKPAPDLAAGAIITLAKASQDHYPEAAKELQTHVYVYVIGGSRENKDKSKQITGQRSVSNQTAAFEQQESRSDR